MKAVVQRSTSPEYPDLIIGTYITSTGYFKVYENNKDSTFSDIQTVTIDRIN